MQPRRLVVIFVESTQRKFFAADAPHLQCPGSQALQNTDRSERGERAAPQVALQQG